MGQTFKIFVSSPGDVGEERAITERIVERLRAEFGNRAELQAFLWEHDAVRATETPQAQFIRPSQADIVICILWARLGTRLPDEFERRPDGSVYESGTAFEFEDAKRAYDTTGKPQLLVYRKTAEPRISFRDPKLVQEHVDQFQALERFFQRWFLNPDGSLKGAFTTFSDADEFERRIYDHLRNILSRSIAAQDGEAAAVQATWHSGSPFRGLHTFEFEHAPVFFGRTRAISEVRSRFELQAADGRAFVLILGMSGSGKSSLMRAGVIPTMTRPGVVEHVGFWRRCVVKASECSGDFFEWLAQKIVAPEVLPELLEAGATVGSLAQMMRTAPAHFPTLLRMGLLRAAETEKRRLKLSSLSPGRLLFVADQFEELFTLRTIDAETRHAFVRFLDALARAEVDPVTRGSVAWVAATMRSDFYHRLAEIPEIVALATGNGEYHLLPPRRQEIADIIRQPARVAGLIFETNDEGASLDAEIEDAAAADPSALPLLQFVLDELYARRRDDRVLTFAAYNEIGGIEGALAHRAEEVFATLEPEVQAALPRVLRNLVNLRDSDEGKPVGNAALLSAFVPGTPERALVEAFLRSDARLLVVDGLGETAHVRVAHEALLSHWSRARSQIDSERIFFRARTRVQAATNQWLTRNKDADFLLPPGGPLAEGADLLKAWRESLPANTIEFIDASVRQERHNRNRRIARIRAVAVALGGLALFAAGLGAWAYRERTEAIAHAIQARENQKIALKAAETLVTEIAQPLKYMSGVSIIQVRGMLDQAEMIYRQLLEQRDQTPEIRYSQAVMLLAFADAHGALGKRAERLKSATDARDILVSLLDSSLPVADVRREIARSHIAVGDAQRALDNDAQALAAYTASFELRRDLVRDEPENLQSRRNLAVAMERIGDIEHDEGRQVAALEQYTKALDILEQAAGTYQVLQRERAVLHNKVGDLRLDAGDDTAALTSYESGKTLIDTLIAVQAGNLLWQQDLAESQQKIAQALAAQNNEETALEYMTDARLTLERQHLQDPANALKRRALATAYNRIGDMLLMFQNETQAGHAYDRALELVKGAGEDVFWQRDLATSYERLANMALLADDYERAVSLYRDSLTATETLTAGDAMSAGDQRDLMINHYNLSRALIAAGQSDEGAKELAVAVTAGEALQQRNPQNLRWQTNLATILNDYAWLLATNQEKWRDPAKAVVLADRAVSLSLRESPAYLDTLAMAYFANRETERAIATAREALDLRGRVVASDSDWEQIKANLALYEKARDGTVAMPNETPGRN